MWWGKSSDDKDLKASAKETAAAATNAAAGTPDAQRYGKPGSEPTPKKDASTPYDSKLPDREKLPPGLQKLVEKQEKERGVPYDPKLPDREKLPPALQKIVDKQDQEDNFFDELVDG